MLHDRHLLSHGPGRADKEWADGLALAGSGQRCTGREAGTRGRYAGTKKALSISSSVRYVLMADTLPPSEVRTVAKC